MSVVALDAVDVRRHGKGVSRVLRNVVPELVIRRGSIRYVVLTTNEGAGLFFQIPPDRLCLVPRMWNSVWEQIGLPSYAQRVRADLVYAHRECGPLWGAPYVLHVPEDPALRWSNDHTRLKERVRTRYERALFLRSLNRAAQIVSSTEATRKKLIEHRGVAGDRIDVVPLGVDSCFFNAEAGAPPEPYIFHLGSADVRDNTVAVVRAYAILRRRRPAAPPLLIAGELGAALQAVRRELAGAALDRLVRLLGRVSDGALSRLYGGAQVCVQPSPNEGFGLQPLEALAAGAPLLAVDTPPVREVVQDAAWLVRSAEPAELAGALERLLTDEGLRARLRARGRAMAQRFTWGATADRLHDLLQRTLRNRR